MARVGSKTAAGPRGESKSFASAKTAVRSQPDVEADLFEPAFPAVHVETVAAANYKKEAWAAALKRVGVPFAKQGTKAYDAVLKVYRDEELPKTMPAAYTFWQKACKEVTGEDYVARGDDAYPEVKRLYSWMMERVGDLKNPHEYAVFWALQEA